VLLIAHFAAKRTYAASPTVLLVADFAAAGAFTTIPLMAKRVANESHINKSPSEKRPDKSVH
jgi:hypothetical protein